MTANDRWSSKEMILQYRARQKRRQAIAYAFMYLAAAFAVATMLAIIGFIFTKGISEISWEFLTSDVHDAGREGGILPIIINTLYLVGLGLLFAAPLSVLAAIYMTEYSKQGILIKIIRYFTSNLAGIPSIIFGLFGFMFFAKILGWSWSLLSGSATIAIVILPTLIRTSEEAILTVPAGYKEGSLALGATKWQTMVKVVIPTASPGIINGIILGMGRIVGETAALVFTLGSGTDIASSLMSSARSLSLHLFILANEGISTSKAYATATVLIVIVLILNLIAGWFGKRINRYKDAR
ncbi:MAG: phosphate ABC transporter permease PstA [Eubacteriales bacterium]|nr:phosphate ABC transporter permease PstA [Eubacteriales bacterium]